MWLVDAHAPDEPAWVVDATRRGVDYRWRTDPVEEGGDLLIVTNDGAGDRATSDGRASDDLATDRSGARLIPESPDVRLHDVEVFARHVVLTTGHRRTPAAAGVPRETLLDDSVTIDDGLAIEAEIPGGLLYLWHNEEPDVDSVLVAGGVVHQAG